MPTTSQKIRDAYSKAELARIFTLREDRFGRAFGMETINVAQRGPENYYHFRDNGARVLATAHLDTVVHKSRRAPHFHETEKSGPAIISGALDDRLGAYVILDMLPKLGVTCDWLLTVGEESGQSTAEHFKPGKNYDWVIEFDRMGTDVVMYQYEDKASRLIVEAAGAEMGHGSFSDIAYLEHLGVKAFNWGVGYRGNYHSEDGYAILGDTFSMVEKYLRFHQQNAGIPMPHEPSPPRYDDDFDWYGHYLAKQDSGDRLDLDCLYCDGMGTVDECSLICSLCKRCMDCGDYELDCLCYLPQELAQPARYLTSDEALRAEAERRMAAIKSESNEKIPF